MTANSVILCVLATAALISFKEMAASHCLKGLPLRNASEVAFCKDTHVLWGLHCTFSARFQGSFFVVFAVDFPVFPKFAAMAECI